MTKRHGCFRQERITVMADIESMFYQVHVPPDDSNVPRFLWWPRNDLESQPEEYEMKGHIFGAGSSLSCAHFALKNSVDGNLRQLDSETTNKLK